MRRIELSIIVPVFNGIAYLGEFFQSLENQGVESLEIIAIDDGSTDGSAAALDALAARNPRMIVLRQPNGGPSAARNAGLRVARGEWMTFADCDDWLAPGTLRAWLDAAKARNVDVHIGNGFEFRDQPEAVERRLFANQPWGETISGWEWLEHASAVQEMPHYVWLQVIRRELIERHSLRFEESVLHQDIIWTTELALTNARFSFSAEPHYGYRQNPTSIIRNPDPEAQRRRAAGYVRVFEYLIESSRRPILDARVRRGLLREVTNGSRHLLGLLRKGVKDGAARGHIARSARAYGLHRTVLASSRSPRELWHALRCFVLLRRYSGHTSNL